METREAEGSGGPDNEGFNAHFIWLRISETGIAFVKVENIRDSLIDRGSIRHFISEEANLSQKRSILEEGDILFSIAGTIGATCLVGREDLPANTNQALAIIRGTSGVFVPAFLRYQLESEVAGRQAKDRERGGGMHNISLEDVGNFELFIPLLNEQRRIVAKLEELLGKVEACQKRLAKIPVILKRFRQAVLAAACSGLLTADWREKNLHTESPYVLFKETQQANTSDLPESWVSVDVGLVIDNLKYGTAHKCGYTKEGVPVLRIPNIADGVIDHSDVKYALLREKEFEQLRLNPGDVLLIRSNGSVSLVGKSALIREPEKGFAYAGYLIRLRPNRSRVLPEYLNLALSSYDVRLQIEIPARSTSGVHNINSEEVRRLRISLPLLAEQNEIVRRVETLFKLADQIEGRYRKAQAEVDKLTQSILAKAFRGELVPTEAELARREVSEYEPASPLPE